MIMFNRKNKISPNVAVQTQAQCAEAVIFYTTPEEYNL